MIGLPGDHIKIDLEKIKINNLIFPAPTHKYDHAGKILKILKNKLTQGYCLYGNYDWENSWDSRYFGLVNRENIVGIYQPIWILNN